MATVQEFVNSVLRLIRVLDSGETPTATESNDALTALNQMLGSWSEAGVPVYQVSRDVYSLTGTASVTIGTGAQIATPRPVKIKAAQVASGGVTVNCEIVTAEIWTTIRDRTRISKFARMLYYDGAFPIATISLWPPPATGSSLELYSIKPLTSFTALSDTINLPPGYEQALRFALAGVLAPEYGSAMPPEYQQNAAQAMSAIAGMNASVLGPMIPATSPAAPMPAAS